MAERRLIWAGLDVDFTLLLLAYTPGDCSKLSATCLRVANRHRESIVLLLLVADCWISRELTSRECRLPSTHPTQIYRRRNTNSGVIRWASAQTCAW